MTDTMSARRQRKAFVVAVAVLVALAAGAAERYLVHAPSEQDRAMYRCAGAASWSCRLFGFCDC